MSEAKKSFSRQYVGLFTVLMIGFAMIFTASAESAQSSKSKAKATPTPKKSAKATPTPKKSAQAKATPTPKKNDKQKASTAKTSTKEKTSAKSNEKTSSKNSKTASKKTETTKSTDRNKKSNEKTTDNKSAKNSGRNSSKPTDSKLKNSTAKDVKKTAAPTEKKSAAKTTTAKTKPKAPVVRTVKPVDEPAPKTETTLAEIIVTGIGTPLRSKAAADATELSRVKLGTILKATEKNSSWYKVRYEANGKPVTGWISVRAVESLDSYKRDDLYRQIVDANYKPQMEFNEAAELADFLADIKDEDAGAETDLKKLTVLRDTLRKIPSEQTANAPYRDFLKAHEKQIVYSEPTGEWIVASNLFWDLQKKYRAQPAVAERIAWEAAQNPLPGECEGYVNCHLFQMRMTAGEYLRLYPRGEKSAEALKDLSSFLEPIAADAAQKTVYHAPTDPTDRADFNNLIVELRTIVSRLALSDKDKTLQQLKTIGESYR